MKKIICSFLLFCFVSNAFAESAPMCELTVFRGCLESDQVAPWKSNCQYYDGYSAMPSDVACSSGTSLACSKIDSCSCPEGQKINTVINNGVMSTSCIPDEPSGDEECPAGQFKDGRGKCNTKCEAPNVYNVMVDACQPPANCTYPQLYNALANACSDNPDNCAEGAHKNVITGECQSYGDTSCPTGFSCADASCLSCVASGDSASSSGGGGSSSGTGSSAGAASSAANGSSGSNTSTAPPPKPPISDTDNGDQGQSTSGSKSIPSGMSQTACLTQNSAQVCTDYQNCELTFGVGKCVGMTSDQNCPNQYLLNGQKYCVLSGSNSGSGSSSGNSGSAGSSGSASSQAGECDPTKKSYDECMGRNKTPNATETSKINSDFNNAANKAIDDYLKVMKDDTDAVVRDGINFKTAPEALKQAVLSHIPQPSTCKPISFTYYNTTKSLDCAQFEKFKLILAWFCSLITIYYIFHLAIKPVPR